MENEKQQYFRKTATGDIITVTEFNTKITYTRTREFRIARFVISYTHTNIRKTVKARVRYFLYNNRIARFKRSVVPAVKNRMATHGLNVYLMH